MQERVAWLADMQTVVGGALAALAASKDVMDVNRWATADRRHGFTPAARPAFHFVSGGRCELPLGRDSLALHTHPTQPFRHLFRPGFLWAGFAAHDPDGPETSTRFQNCSSSGAHTADT